MNGRSILLSLVAGLLFLPIVILVLLVTGRLLTALDDAAGAAFVDRMALAVGVLWTIALVCLPIVLALRELASAAPDRDDVDLE